MVTATPFGPLVRLQEDGYRTTGVADTARVGQLAPGKRSLIL